MKRLKALVGAAALLALVACGGGGGNPGTNVFNGGASGGGTTTTTQALTLSVSLLNGAGNATTALVGSNTLRVQAVLKKAGVVQADQLVQFSVDQAGNYATLDQLSALTDTNGIATVTLKPGTASGAGRVKVLATLLDGSTVEGAANFVASTTPQSSSTLTLSSFTTDSATVSAYGTTGFSVTVLENAGVPSQPVTVTFASDCAVGKASVTSSTQTNAAGVAVGTFEDIGCASSSARTVVLTASIASNSAQRAIQVLPSTVGSLRFVSVNPSDASITLKGNGGTGRQENAQLTFKLVDQAGNGVADTEVCFDSTTYVGGLTVDGFNNQPGKLPTNQGSTALCGSDAMSLIRYVKRTDKSGNVSVQIASGTVPTPVRIRARSIYPAGATTPLETFSDSLSISTGLPLQRSMSLSVDKANIDAGNGTAGGQFDGDKAVLTVRLADQFSNPVPDGTKVTFVASGGSVCTSQNGSCSTTNGVCSCEIVGQNRRPKDGRVVVLAYAVGLEDYIDVNGDNVYTLADDGSNFTDLADAFVDANKSGSYSGASVNGDVDTPIPFQPVANYISGDGVRGNAHIRASSVIYFSAPSGTGDPTVVIPGADLSATTNLLTGTTSTKFFRMDPSNGCPNTVPTLSFSAILDDGYGNPMAAGTSVTAVDFSDNLAAKSVRPSAVLPLGARAPSRSIDGDLNGVGGGGNVIKVTPWSTTADLGNVTTLHQISIQGVKEKCSGNASFALDVSSPKGGAASSARVLYEGEPRTTSRFGFPVSYIDVINLDLVSASVAVGETARIGTANVSPLGATVTGYSVDWGDGSAVQTGTGTTITTPTHSYTTAGSYQITLTVQDSNGNSYSATETISVTP